MRPAIALLITVVSTFAFVALIVVLLPGFSQKAMPGDLVRFFHRPGFPSSSYEVNIAISLLTITVSTLAFVGLMLVLLLASAKTVTLGDLARSLHSRGSFASSRCQLNVVVSLLIAAVSSFALVAFIVLLLLGFSQQVTFDDVVGLYRARYPFGSEELELARDGTYLQSVLINGQTTPTMNKGHWRFYKEDPNVDLLEPMTVVGDWGRLNPSYRQIVPGLHFGLEVYESSGKVSLPTDPDWGYGFKRIR